jgi:hypothetical protein
MLKVNVDTELEKNTGQGLVATVARDKHGRFRGASVVVYPGEDTTKDP